MNASSGSPDAVSVYQPLDPTKQQIRLATFEYEGDVEDIVRRALNEQISQIETENRTPHVPRAADGINEIDRIVGTGFNWGPPSVLVDTMTPAGATRMIEEAGLPVPQALAAIGADAGQTFQHPHINIGKFFVAG